MTWVKPIHLGIGSKLNTTASIFLFIQWYSSNYKDTLGLG